MSCDRHTDAIVDHACGAEIAAEAAAHLDGCAACRRMFDEQLRLVRDLDGQVALALQIEPSPRFVTGDQGPGRASGARPPHHHVVGRRGSGGSRSHARHVRLDVVRRATG